MLKHLSCGSAARQSLAAEVALVASLLGFRRRFAPYFSVSIRQTMPKPMIEFAFEGELLAFIESGER